MKRKTQMHLSAEATLILKGQNGYKIAYIRMRKRIDRSTDVLCLFLWILMILSCNNQSPNLAHHLGSSFCWSVEVSLRCSWTLVDAALTFDLVKHGSNHHGLEPSHWSSSSLGSRYLHSSRLLRRPQLTWRLCFWRIFKFSCLSCISVWWLLKLWRAAVDLPRGKSHNRWDRLRLEFWVEFHSLKTGRLSSALCFKVKVILPGSISATARLSLYSF